MCLYFLQAGISIRPSAIRFLMQYISEHNDPIESILEEVVRGTRELSAGGSAFLEESQVKHILLHTSEEIKEVEEPKINQRIRKAVEESVIVLNAYEDFPYVEKSKLDGKFKVAKERGEVFFGKSEDKTRGYINHFDMLEERLQRHPSTYTTLDEPTSSKVIEVPYINNLPGLKTTVKVFGILLKREDMRYYLEDRTSSVRLAIGKDIEADKGFFLEENHIQVIGYFKNEELVVKAVSHPLIEQPSVPDPLEMDFFGAYSYATKKILNEDLSDVHSALPESIMLPHDSGNPKEKMLITLSNVGLDNPRTMGRIRELLGGIEQLKPRMIVLMGKLFNNPQQNYSELKSHITQFAQTLNEFTYLCNNTAWVIMPALEDPGISNILPRKPLPPCLLEPLKKKVKIIVNTTNPCRISFYGTELMFSRCNLLQYFKRLNVFQSPHEDFLNVIFTVMSQRSLVPVNRSHIPVVWNYAHCMEFYKAPKYIVLGDLCNFYEQQIEGTYVLNPGNFAKDFSFAVMYPLLGKVEPSKLP